MTEHLLALIAAHLGCSTMAAERPLSVDEVQYCSAVYQEVKFGFVPGMTAQRYSRLSGAERADVNTKGFLAFHAWRVANPDLVAQLNLQDGTQ